jgi:hypothetical protein
MAEISNIFRSRIPSGSLALNAQAVLGQPVRIHQALTRAISAATFNLLDSSNISAAARVAQDLADKNAHLTGSPNGVQGIPGVHPIIDGVADLRQAEERLARG